MAIYQGDKKVANVYNINNNSYSVPIGCIIPFSGSTIPVGFLLCDGSEVSKTDYADLYAIIADIYGTATDTSKFKLPDLRDKFIQGANGNLGTSKEAGLPNITGKFYHDTNVINSTLEGAFSYTSGSSLNLANSATATSGYVTLDASKSNSIYGNSDTVQPPSVCLAFIIKALKVSDQYAAGVGALIDDTATDVTDKTWSAKKINESIPNSEDFVQNLKMWSAGDIETLALESVSGFVTISSAVTGMPIDSAAWIGSVNATSTHRQISVQPFGNPSMLYSKVYNASTQIWSVWSKIDAGSIEGKKATDLLQNLGTLTSGSLLDYILTLPASGFIYCNGNVTDTPVVGTYFIVDVRKMGTTYGVTAIKFNSGEIYTNRYNSTSKAWYGWKQMATINDKSTTSETETYSVKKINDMLSMFPFKWKLIGTSTPETGEASDNTFKQTMSGGNPFCVYHSSGVFCFGNGVPANRGKLYGMTSGAVASVTYTTAGLLTVQVGSGTAYIYEMEK
nr:MAG TPA: tail collar domain [Bacteriophage sp.]